MLIAAPVHLVALVVPATRSLLVGVAAVPLAQGLGTAVPPYLGLRAGAALLGLGLARASRLGRQAA